MVMETPGRIGALLFASPQAAGVNEEALIETITAASRDALAGRGLAFVQAMFDPQEAREIAVVGTAGLDLLAELAHMQLDLTHSPSPWPIDGLTWQRWGEFSERELGDVIASTYVGSMDCPRLSGLRDATEVLESHKSCGVFCPDSWWIARKDGHSVGCVLVNDSASAQTAEVVYIGVVAAHRRQGVGRAMLRRAADVAYRRRRSALLLAVDEQNRSAKALYEAEGFRQTRRQLAFIMTPTEQRKAK
jgi:ribosomal protein S18 acetylase RimI-like enzyme